MKNYLKSKAAISVLIVTIGAGFLAVAPERHNLFCNPTILDMI